MHGNRPLSAGLTARDLRAAHRHLRQVLRLTTAIVVRLRVLSAWATRAHWVTEEDSETTRPSRTERSFWSTSVVNRSFC